VIISSHQPSFLPWIGYWNKLACSDVFIAVGGVDYHDGNYQNRVMLGGQWLTLPVKASTKHGPISDVQLSDTEAIRKVATRLKLTLCGKRMPFGKRLDPIVQYLESTTESRLMWINLTLQGMVADILNVNSRMFIDTLRPCLEHSKTERVVQLVRRWVANDAVYYAGAGAAENYLDKDQLAFPVFVQHMKSGYNGETVLQLIAQESDPLYHVRNCADWRLM
jgi:hypothetical protein